MPRGLAARFFFAARGNAPRRIPIEHVVRTTALRPAVVRSALAALAALVTAVATAADGYSTRLDELVNQYRASQGIGQLASESGLAALAREHSEAMAKSGQLDHDGFQSRFRRSGYGMCVENVGWSYHTPEKQLDAWRESPGHDQNLRDPRVTRMGTGEASDYVTWIACR